MIAYMLDSQYNKNFNLLQNFQPITEKQTSSKTRTLVEIVVEGQNFRQTDFPTDYYAKFRHFWLLIPAMFISLIMSKKRWQNLGTMHIVKICKCTSAK